MDAKPTIISLGAGTSQSPLIRVAKEVGYSVAAIDRNASAPGAQYADFFINLSTHDKAGNIAALTKLQPASQFVAVVARTTGLALYTAAAIAERFHLRGLTRDLVRICLEKSELRSFCHRHGLPAPTGRVVDSLETSLDNLVLPVIVKPDTTKVGKDGVFLCTSEAQLHPFLTRAQEASANGKVELESFVEGIDVACLCLAQWGQASILAWWVELVGVSSAGSIVGPGVSTPSVVEGTQAETSMAAVVSRIVEQFPGAACLLLFSFRVTSAGDPWLIEMHGDLGRDLIAEVLLPTADPLLRLLQAGGSGGSWENGGYPGTGASPHHIALSPLPCGWPQDFAGIFGVRDFPGVQHYGQPSRDGSLPMVEGSGAGHHAPAPPMGRAPNIPGREPLMARQAVILIGGSYLQLPTIQWAKELGLYTVATDRNPAVPGRDLADQFELISGTDLVGLQRLAESLASGHRLVGTFASTWFPKRASQYSVRGELVEPRSANHVRPSTGSGRTGTRLRGLSQGGTSSDFGLEAVAEISSLRGLPACPPASVRLALNKAASKKIWEAAGVPTPKGMLLDRDDDPSQVAGHLRFPLMVKPVDSSGSQGMTSAYRQDDLHLAFRAAQRFSEKVIVEELVAGHHIDVNGFFWQNRFVPCGTMDRFFSPPPNHYPFYGCQPSILSPLQEGTVYSVVEDAARALGTNVGPVKADAIWTEGGPVLLELGPRFHGDVGTAFVTPLSTGGSTIKAWLACLAGEPEPQSYLGSAGNQVAGWRALFPTEEGTLVSVAGVEGAQKQPGIREVYVSVEPGAVLKSPKDNTALCGFVRAVAPSRQELHTALSNAAGAIRFNTLQKAASPSSQ